MLRGVNVGANRRLPMAELRTDLESIGLEDVATYIQSGNVVFRTDAGEDEADEHAAQLGERIAGVVADRHGFEPNVMVLTADSLRAAAEANPFPEAEAEPKKLHLYFLAEQPADADYEALRDAATPSERFHLGNRVFYLHTPDGYGRSRLATRAERMLGVAATARNWRTIVRLMEMAEAAAGD